MLDYPYFKENYKMIVIDLSKEQALDADPGGIEQCFSLLKKQKKLSKDFSQGAVRVL